MEHRHKKLERKSGGHHHTKKAKKAAAAAENGQNSVASKHGDVTKYIGVSLIKKEIQGHDLTHLQKRALDLTGAPLINYNAAHDSADKAAAAATAAKQAVYRTQSLNPNVRKNHQKTSDADLQQLHQLLYLQQLQQQLQQHQYGFMTAATATPSGGGKSYDVYDSGHGSLDGSSCGSDHDIGCGSFQDAAAAAEGGALAAASKRMLEACNSMPLLPSYGTRPDDDREVVVADDLEIEVEDEQKYLPLDLFQDVDQHSKLCTSISLRRLNTWGDDQSEMTVAAGSGGPKQGIRKTTSLVVSPQPTAPLSPDAAAATLTPSDAFNLFSDQLDLLSSIRSNWEKSSSSSSSTSSPAPSSCASSDSSCSSSAAAAAMTAAGSSSCISDSEDLSGLRKYSTSSVDSCASGATSGGAGDDDDVNENTTSKRKNLETAIKNLTYDMSTFLLRKV